MTREVFLADLRVNPAGLTRGSAFFKLTAVEDHCRAGAPRVRPSDPLVKNTKLTAFCPSRADAPIIRHRSVQNNHQAVPLATRTKAYSVTQIPCRPRL